MSKEINGTSETKKKKSAGKRIASIIGNIIMWLFIIFAIVMTVFAFSAQSNSDGIPTIAGKVISPVLSPSMEPTIKQGDIILSNRITEEEAQDLTVGTIISFRADLDGDGQPEINTHRIKEVNKQDGFLTYKTQGDNNQFEDNYDVYPADVISTFDENKDIRIPIAGSVINFLMTPTGFFVAVVIPLIIFFLFEIIMFIRKLLALKNADKKQITAADEELIKQKAIEEYLRSQNAGKEEVKSEEDAGEDTEEDKKKQPDEIKEVEEIKEEIKEELPEVEEAKEEIKEEISEVAEEKEEIKEEADEAVEEAKEEIKEELPEVEEAKEEVSEVFEEAAEVIEEIKEELPEAEEAKEEIEEVKEEISETVEEIKDEISGGEDDE